jgi:hypothetical protein
MFEPLTTSLLLELIEKLNVAFPRARGAISPAALADVYRNGLHGLSGDAVRDAVARCIERDQYFPKVAGLRVLAAAFDKRRAINMQQHRSGDMDQCPICFARAEMHGNRSIITHDRRSHGLKDYDQEYVA